MRRPGNCWIYITGTDPTIVTKHLAASSLRSLVFIESGTGRYDCMNRHPDANGQHEIGSHGFWCRRYRHYRPQDCGCQFGYHAGATPCFMVILFSNRQPCRILCSIEDEILCRSIGYSYRVKASYLAEQVQLRSLGWKSLLFLFPPIPVSTSTGRTVPDVQPNLPLPPRSTFPVRDILR